MKYFLEEVKRNNFKGTKEISCPFPIGPWQIISSRIPIGEQKMSGRIPIKMFAGASGAWNLNLLVGLKSIKD